MKSVPVKNIILKWRKHQMTYYWYCTLNLTTIRVIYLAELQLLRSLIYSDILLLVPCHRTIHPGLPSLNQDSRSSTRPPSFSCSVATAF